MQHSLLVTVYTVYTVHGYIYNNKKAFHKNAETCRDSFQKNQKQTGWDSHDNTFSDYHPYIDLSNHTHHNSLFISVDEFLWICFGMVVCIGIGLWYIYV